ncbi:MAG: carbohydrate ABC transporter permease [Clostridiales bacterium]|jgi:putative aldouronate transport system permease protein|nr:carbohydrate ABC transporter permease [Clostridiales bacterium]
MSAAKNAGNGANGAAKVAKSAAKARGGARKIKMTPAEIAFDAANAAFLFLLMAVTLFPFVYVINSSISDPIALMQARGIMILPKGVQFYAYRQVFQNPMLLRGYANTVFLVLAGTALNVAMTSIGAYVLSRPHFMLRNAVMLFISFTMFFSGGLIPSFVLVQGLGIYDSFLALLLPTAMSAWNLVIMRTSFAAIPISLEESARLDGARDLTILARIIIPLSMPVVSVMILFYGVGHWNSWFNAMIYLRDRALYPLQLILREVLLASQTDDMLIDMLDDGVRPGLKEQVKYATVIVATLPILCVYPFLQKFFVKGVIVGAIKQ